MLASACSDDDDAKRAGPDAAPDDSSVTDDAGADASDHDADAGTDAGPTTVVAHARELRGAWVATVYGLDWPSGTGVSAEQQRLELIAIVDRLAALRMNAIVFQIRPESDALYASTLEPWSRFLTGTQGGDPGWDPLAELVSEAHARGIEVHAWMNPYRGLTSASVAAAPSHVTQTLSEHALAYNGMLWMDPAAPKVRAHVVSVVSDVVARYDVDGIHFDDYFYPYPDAAGTDFPDQPSYDAYLSAGGALGRGDWRRSNVHLLIEAVASAVSGSKPWVRFGVSPFGIYRPGVPEGIQGLDAYATIYCDPLEWVTQGWVDYLAPQLYWPTTQTAQAYGTLLPWWASTCSGKAWIFAGSSLSKLGTSSAWTAAEIEQQVLITRSQRDAGALGNLFFRMQQLADDLDGVASLLADKLYLAPALPPPLFTAVDQIVDPPLVDASGGAVTLSHPEPGSLRAWSVYRQTGAAYELDRIVPATTLSFALDPGSWAIAAVARSDAESRGRLVTIE
jgi:uncharacterized lipoprotein YddW (UPF0748 family)